MKQRFELPVELRPSLDILIVENDPASARLTQEAFLEAGMTEGLHTVPDGDEALAFLRREEQYANHLFPDIIFLDLQLPRKSGLEVLAELKSMRSLHPSLLSSCLARIIRNKSAQYTSSTPAVIFVSRMNWMNFSVLFKPPLNSGALW